MAERGGLNNTDAQVCARGKRIQSRQSTVGTNVGTIIRNVKKTI